MDSRLDPVVLKSLEKEPADRWQSAGEVKDRVSRLDAPLAEAPSRRPSLAWSLWLLAAAVICGMLAATASPQHFTGLYLGKDQEKSLWFATAILVLLAGVQALRHAYPDRLTFHRRPKPKAPADPGSAANAWKVLAAFFLLALMTMSLTRTGVGSWAAMAAMALLLAANVLAIISLVRRRGRSSAWGIPAVTLLLLLGLFPSSAASSRPATAGSGLPTGWAESPEGHTVTTQDRPLHSVWPSLAEAKGVRGWEGRAALERAQFDAREQDRLKARYADFGWAQVFGVEFPTRESALAGKGARPGGTWSHHIETPRLQVWVRCDGSPQGVAVRTELLRAIEANLFPGAAPRRPAAPKQASLRDRNVFVQAHLDLDLAWPRRDRLPEGLRDFEAAEGVEALNRAGLPDAMMADLALARAQLHLDQGLLLIGFRFKNEFVRQKWAETLRRQGHPYFNHLNLNSLDSVICNYDAEVPGTAAAMETLLKLINDAQPRTR